jgi:hypothetical protein
MDCKFIYGVCEEEYQEAELVGDDSGKIEPPATFLSALEGISNARK